MGGLRCPISRKKRYVIFEWPFRYVEINVIVIMHPDGLMIAQKPEAGSRIVAR